MTRAYNCRVASDRRFGLPHPFDSDPSGGSSAGRKPGLWESLKRALGTAPAADEDAIPPVVPDEPGLPALAAPPQPAAPAASSHTPAPPPAALPRVDPIALRRPSPTPAVEPTLVELASRVPFLDDLPAASPPSVEASQAPPSVEASPPDPSPPAEIALAGMPETALAAPGLARGLASFSRDNAEREKKFAHLLRDSASSGRRRPPGSRKRS